MKFDSLDYQTLVGVLIVVVSKCYADLLDNWFLAGLPHLLFYLGYGLVNASLIPIIYIGPNLQSFLAYA